MKTGYLALEVKRAIRNPRTLIFTLAFPVALFLLYCGMYGNQTIDPSTHVTAKAYLMVSMAAYGAFMAAMTGASRTALERASGWQRQLRLTPLTGSGYLLAKGLVALLVALPPIVLVSAIGGLAEGVHLSAGGWLQVVLGVWAATIPFAVLGLLVGQLATADSLQPITMTLMLLLAFIGGIFIPTAIFPHWLANIAQVLPSYWLAEIGHGALYGNTDVGKAVLILGIYTVVLGFAVVRRYRRDSARV
ncbi:MAG: ABC transporter permease [Sciscionella sp.]|nr:ABC transporter permease [Sciscionella sp.]